MGQSRIMNFKFYTISKLFQDVDIIQLNTILNHRTRAICAERYTRL